MHALAASSVRRALVASVLTSWTAFGNAEAGEPAAGGELKAYVAQQDESFRWREITSGRIGKVEYTEFLLTSQTWRGIEWKHQFYLLRPSRMKSDVSSALLFLHGGRWKPEYETELRATDLPREAKHFARLTEAIGAPVGVLRQVPFQPIFERREDALIAYTLDQYLRTGESDWPVLLPMVKSAVRAMDAMQSIARERWNVELTQFTVAGASKRGWTSWLTAAVDPRVMAVAPMVIDVLNMRAQMDLQRATWGDLSDEIQDYASLDIPSRLGSERGAELLSMVDPFSYRAWLTKPKLIMLSTNDRYWPLDALKLYWSELPEPKNVIYVPNQGHGLRDAARVIGALSAVHRYAATGKTLPRTRWSFASTDDALEVRVKADSPWRACASGAQRVRRRIFVRRGGFLADAGSESRDTSARLRAAICCTPPCSRRHRSRMRIGRPSPRRRRFASREETRRRMTIVEAGSGIDNSKEATKQATDQVPMGRSSCTRIYRNVVPS